VTSIWRKVYGLTGGIASGKSTVGKILRGLNCTVIDADQISRRIMQPGHEALEETIEAFGEEFLTEDGLLDRKKLGAHVFGNDVEMSRLTSIVHPHLLREAELELWKALSGSSSFLTFFENAIVFEMGQHHTLRGVVTVTCTRETQIARMASRDGFTAAQAEARLDAQMDLEEKAGISDWVIHNDGNEKDLKKAAFETMQQILRAEIRAKSA